MNKPKISVIIPVYNKEKYLNNTINGIINQTYKNLEIIIVNDGSTDESKYICEKKAIEDSRIILINTDNYGAGQARNTGLDKATGEYISFIDADDYIIPTYYEVLYQMIENTGADISECRFKRTNNIKEKLNDIEKPDIKVLSNEEKIMQLYGRNMEEYVNTVIMCNKLFKRELFKNGIKYPIKRIIDDEFIVYHLIYNSKKIVMTNQIMYNYIQSEESTMRGEFKVQRVYDTFDVYDEVYQFFLDKKIKGLEENILIRYLEYGLELLQKVKESNIEKKVEINQYIRNKIEEKWKIILNKNINEEMFKECKKIYLEINKIF